MRLLKFPSPGFTLIELLVVITIIGILANIGLNTFSSSQKKSRDTKRKGHLRQMTDALEAYHNDKGQYPAAAADGSGNLMGCEANAEEVCTWGTSAFQNTTTNTVYMIKLPEDMTTGYTFYYDATIESGLNTKYQLYARLENERDKDVIVDAENDPQIYNISCGSQNCNYGVSSSNIMPETGRTLSDDPGV